ncbi:hypothetical protein B0H16DRAFT_1728258 [Mycena metata]|uniref:Uncharacterized protein n=1 Tax=Mycena metata TaxID=1033252 RepID=A0AAD7IG39_9AGAR|nr:hypothetical protein B0H16DRAFT_1728258 [Mycena metata]
MRFSTLTMMVAASVVLATPTPFKRGINCPTTDKDGTALKASSAFADSDGNEFAQCTYADAGPCAYFFADGSFSSGSSTCPKGLPQDDASNSPAAAGATTASTGTTATAGAIDSSIVCPATDKDGTPLTQSSSFKDDEGNEFAQCTYKDAGPCAFFFADGSFSSGSSTCPKGLPQTSTGGGNTSPPAGTTTQAAPPVTTTSTTQAAPPATTSTTQAAPPPVTTTSSTAALSTSTSTLFSTVQPPATTSSTSTTTSTSAAFAVPPATTATDDAGSDDPTTTFVIVTATSTPTGGAPVANNGLGEGNTNGAGSVGVHMLAMMPIVLVLGALL